MSSSSLRLCLELNELLKAVFSDSVIASSFQLNKIKCSYYVNYGLAPFITDLVVKDVRSSPYFMVLFDESFNKVLEQNEMDIQLRYWNDGDDLVKIDITILNSYRSLMPRIWPVHWVEV